jgi:hypothetical protein
MLEFIQVFGNWIALQLLLLLALWLRRNDEPIAARATTNTDVDPESRTGRLERGQKSP